MYLVGCVLIPSRFGDQMQAVARVPPSQMLCLPPFSGQLREPTASPVVVGPPLSAVNRMMIFSIIFFEASAAVTFPTPSSIAPSMPAKFARLWSWM